MRYAAVVATWVISYYNCDTCCLSLILFNVYGTQNLLKQLVFRHHSRGTINNLSILEHDIGRSCSNRIFLERLSSILNIQFRDSKRVPVL